jgi:hypothetical protein
MKTDEEFHGEVDFLLDSLWQIFPDLERAYQTFIEKGEAFQAEAERGGRRLRTLRQEFEKANVRLQGHYQAMHKTLSALRDVLSGWRAPGREYVWLADQARVLRQNYVDKCNAMREEIHNILEAVREVEEGPPYY